MNKTFKEMINEGNIGKDFEKYLRKFKIYGEDIQAHETSSGYKVEISMFEKEDADDLIKKITRTSDKELEKYLTDYYSDDNVVTLEFSKDIKF